MARLLYFKHSAHFDNPARRIFLAGEQAPNWDTVKKDMKDTKWLSESGKAAAKELAGNWQKEIAKLRNKSVEDRKQLLKDILGSEAENIVGKSNFDTKGEITVDLSTQEGKAKFEKKGMLEILADNSGVLGAAFSAFKNLKLMAYATVYTQLNAQDPPIDANYLPDGSTLEMTDGEITLTIPDGNGGTQTAKIDLFPWDLLQKEEAPAVAAVPPTPAAEPPAAPAPEAPIAPVQVEASPISHAPAPIAPAFPPTSPDPDIFGVTTIIPEATAVPSSFVMKGPVSVAEQSNLVMITQEKPSDVALEKRYVGKDPLQSISEEKPQLVDVNKVEAAQVKELSVKKEKIRQLSAKDTIAVAASVLGQDWIDQQKQKGITEGTSAYVTAAKAELTARLTNPNTILSVETVPAETTTPSENKSIQEQEQEAASDVLKIRVGTARLLLSQKVAETYQFPDGGNGLSIGGDSPQVQWNPNGTADLMLGKLTVDLQSGVLDTFPNAKRSIEIQMKPLQLTSSKDLGVLTVDITANELAEKMFTAFQEAAGEPEVRFNWMGNLPKTLQDKYEMSSHESMAAAQMRIVEARLANPDRRFAYAKDGSPSFLLIEKTSSGARAVEVQVASDWSDRLGNKEQIFTVQGGAKFFDENGNPLTSSRVTTEAGTNAVQFNTLEEVLNAKASPPVAEMVDTEALDTEEDRLKLRAGFGLDAETTYQDNLGVDKAVLNNVVSGNARTPENEASVKVRLKELAKGLSSPKELSDNDFTITYDPKTGKTNLEVELSLPGEGSKTFKTEVGKLPDDFVKQMQLNAAQIQAIEPTDTYSAEAILKDLAYTRLIAKLDTDFPAWAAREGTKSNEAAAQAEHTRLAEEIRNLSQGNHWGGVEDAYVNMQALEKQGIVLTYEEHRSGATAAQERGDFMEAASRLRKAEGVYLATPANSINQATAELAEIERDFGMVRLTAGIGTEFRAYENPFAPLQRAAVDLATKQIKEKGSFVGLLPKGEYTLGSQTFLLEDAPVSINEGPAPREGIFSRIFSRFKRAPEERPSMPPDAADEEDAPPQYPRPDYLDGKLYLDGTVSGYQIAISRIRLKAGDEKEISVKFITEGTPSGPQPVGLDIQGGLASVSDSVLAKILVEGWESKIAEADQAAVKEHAKQIYVNRSAQKSVESVRALAQDPVSPYEKGYDYKDYKDFLISQVTLHTNQINSIAAGIVN